MSSFIKGLLVLIGISILMGCTSDVPVDAVETTQQAQSPTILPSNDIERLKDGSKVAISEVNKVYFTKMELALNSVLASNADEKYNLAVSYTKAKGTSDDIYTVVYDIDTENGPRYVENYVSGDGRIMNEASEPASYGDGFEPLLDSFKGAVCWEQAIQIALDDQGVTMDDVWFVSVKQHSINQMFEVKYGLEYDYMYSIDNQEGKIQVRGDTSPNPDD